MIILEKPEGITPIDFWKKYRDLHFKSTLKGGICGKLDPMATGKLLILLGEECKNMSEYLTKEKVYEFEIVIGLQTDTDDILGLVDNMQYNNTRISEEDVDKISNQVLIALKKYSERRVQKFHPYSAIWVEGLDDKGVRAKQPLWWWSQKGLIGNVKIPEKEVMIEFLEIGEPQVIQFEEFLIQTLSRLDKVEIDAVKFRVPQIKEKWNSLKAEELNNSSKLIRIKVCARVSTGTYIRQIVRDLREELKIPILCEKIHRKEIII